MIIMMQLKNISIIIVFLKNKTLKHKIIKYKV